MILPILPNVRNTNTNYQVKLKKNVSFGNGISRTASSCILSGAILLGSPIAAYYGADSLLKAEHKRKAERTMGYKIDAPIKEKALLTEKTMSSKKFLEYLSSSINDKFKEPIFLKEMRDFQKSTFENLSEEEKQEILDVNNYIESISSSKSNLKNVTDTTKQKAYETVYMIQKMLQKDITIIVTGGKKQEEYKNAIVNLLNELKKEDSTIDLSGLILSLHKTRDKIANELPSKKIKAIEEECEQKINAYNKLVEESVDSDSLTLPSKITSTTLGLIIGVLTCWLPLAYIGPNTRYDNDYGEDEGELGSLY